METIRNRPVKFYVRETDLKAIEKVEAEHYQIIISSQPYPNSQEITIMLKDRPKTRKELIEKYAKSMESNGESVEVYRNLFEQFANELKFTKE